MNPHAEYLRLDEIAASLDVTQGFLLAQVRRNEFPPVTRVGRGIYRVKRADYQRWLASNDVQTRDARVRMAAARGEG